MKKKKQIQIEPIEVIKLKITSGENLKQILEQLNESSIDFENIKFYTTEEDCPKCFEVWYIKKGNSE